jgi:hypothetical protein
VGFFLESFGTSPNPRSPENELDPVFVKRILKQKKVRAEKSGRVEVTETPTMSEEELRFPEWQKPLQDLILEFNREKLLEKVKKVEAMIIERDRQLAGSSGGQDERMALGDAMSIIRVLIDRATN